MHPQTQGKIERYHRSMKNVIKLNHYFCPSELENAIDGWVKYYNERRFHESLDNLTPKDVYFGQGEKIKKIREIIKQNSINKRIFDNKTRKYKSKQLHLQLCTFVWYRTFGSNLQGMHGGGAARVAVSKFGVIMGQGVGIQG